MNKNKFLQKVINILFYLQLLILSIIFIFILAFYLILPIPFFSKEKNRSRVRNSVRLYGKWVLKFAVWPYVKIEFVNLQKQEADSCIFVCNHRSASDPYLMALLDSELVQVVKQWPFNIPFYGFFAKEAEYISVLDLTFDEFKAECSRQLRKGVSIAAFPEGTRSGSSKIGSFTSAIFRIAIENKAAICPVCITGNEKIPDRYFNITPGKIIIHRLDLIKWEEYKDLSAYQLKNLVRNTLQKEADKIEQRNNNA